MKKKIIIYQALVRLFGNGNPNRQKNGTIDENGFTFVGTRNGEPYTYTINPNGMWDLTHNADLASISLNGGSSEVYNRVTRPKGMPENAYDTMLSFAKTCKDAGTSVAFTVVDVITPEEIAAAQAKADELGIPLHVRAYIS